LGSILLLLSRTDSMVSGIPWPMILVEPNLMRRPAIRPPMAGRTMTSAPSVLYCGDAKEMSSRP